MSRRSILLIGPTPPPFHGVAMAIQGLLHSSLARRFHVRHLELADRRGIAHVNKPDIHDVFLFLRQWLKLMTLLIRRRPDLTYLVLSQTTVGFCRDSLLLWPALAFRSRLIVHLHGGHFHDWYRARSRLMRFYVRTLMRRVTRVIVLGQSLKDQFADVVSSERVEVVPNGVDWRCPDRTPSGRLSRRYRVLHLSTLNRLKGALVLIRAIPLVIRQRKDVEFVLAGPWSHPDDQQWAERYIAEEDLGGFVRFTGQVQGADKLSWLTSSDIFVFPGVQQEGQPLVVLEAMAAGLPVIFTDRGCLRETVIAGETGLEIPINDAHALADAVIWLLEHPSERASMGRRARRRYRACYTKERHIRNMASVLARSCAEEAA